MSGNNRKLSKELCFSVASTVDSRKELENIDASIYNKCVKKSWIGVLFKKQHRELTKEFCFEVATTCNSRLKLQKYDESVYNKCRRQGWLDELYPKEYLRNHPSKHGYKSQKAWKKRNPAKVAAHDKQRKTRRKGATPLWLSKEQWKEMNYIYDLSKELTALMGEDYHVDHIVPLQGKNVCGLHVPWNIQVLPSDINMAKHNKFEGVTL